MVEPLSAQRERETRHATHEDEALVRRPAPEEANGPDDEHRHRGQPIIAGGQELGEHDTDQELGDLTGDLEARPPK